MHTLLAYTNFEIPRFGKACKRKLVKSRKEKLRSTFRNQSHGQNRAFTKKDNGIYFLCKIELYFRYLKGFLSKMPSETKNKNLFKVPK